MKKTEKKSKREAPRHAKSVSLEALAQVVGGGGGPKLGA
jgi:hypothetical protein